MTGLTEISVIIASIAVIVSIVGVYLADKRTRDSNELVRTDINARLRPWVVIEGCKPEFIIADDGEVVTWENRNNLNKSRKSVRIVARFKNIGAIPCHAVSRMIKSDKQLTRNLGNIVELKTINSTIMMPNETILKHIDVDYNEWVNIPNNPLFFGLWIVYTVSDQLESEMGKIWEFYRGGNSIRDNWYEEKRRID